MSLSFSPCTGQVSEHPPENPVRCKNLLRQAEARLLAMGLRSSDVQTLLAPMYRLLADYAFWQHQSDGLALFVAPEVFRAYCLPLALTDLVVVTAVPPQTALATPEWGWSVLYPGLEPNRNFPAQCTRHSVNQVALTNAPTSLDEALQYNDPQTAAPVPYQNTILCPTRHRRSGGDLFGTGAAADDTKNDLMEYFRQVDRGFAEAVQHAHAPVVLAGVEYLLPLYKAVTAHTAVVESSMTGNPDGCQRRPCTSAPGHSWNPSSKNRYRRYAGTGRPQAISPRPSRPPRTVGWRPYSWPWGSSAGVCLSLRRRLSRCCQRTLPRQRISWIARPSTLFSIVAQSMPSLQTRCRHPHLLPPSCATQ